MIIDEEQLFTLYMQWVNKVAEDNDWKTTFGPKEIVHTIANIIKEHPEIIKQ